MIHFEWNMRTFGQALAVSTVPLLTALLQRNLVVLAISSISFMSFIYEKGVMFVSSQC